MSEQMIVESSIKNNSIDETNEENPAPVAETSSSTQFTRIIHSSSNNKSNLEDFTPNVVEKTTSLERNGKRTKNVEESNAENSSGEAAQLEDLFSNDLVLSTILKNLDIKDLLLSRQVNRLWNLEATKVLLQKNNLHRIYISNDTVASCRYNLYKRRFASYNTHTTYNNAVTIKDFQNLIENSMIFPCNSFVVSDDPLSEIMTDFFRKHGHVVKILWFEPKQCNKENKLKTTACDIFLIATEHMPNLETLEFPGDYETSSPPSVEIEKALECAAGMNKLHTLGLNGTIPVHLYSTLLKKANKLKNIYFDRYFLHHFYKDGLTKMMEIPGAISQLKNIRLMFFLDMLDLFEKVVMQTPRFSLIQIRCTSMKFYDDRDLHKVGKILSAIFEQSSESLTELLIWSPLTDIPGLTIPIFPNLKRLNFTSMPWGVCPPLLPTDVTFVAKCPNVETVELYFRGECQEKGPEKMLHLWNPFVSVRHLQFEFADGKISVSDEWVTRLCYLFPSITSARFLNSISPWAVEHFAQRGIRVIVEA